MSDDEERKKPKPARARPTPASENPGLRGQRKRPDGPRGGSGRSRRSARKSGKRPSAPTPVREVMDEPALEPTPLEEFPERSFESEDGTEWLVRSTGFGSVGHTAEGGAMLMHLSFSRGEAPGTVALETMVAAESLEELSEIRLIRLLAEASHPPEDGGDS